uniref:Predicted protein n=1 Tax=Hordeum vulgare subsp. vulgare TaxID=112509 RepID=F2EAT1_HORVV|nr:predicted protein [Hordeum vulgare subsp. vulgare]
MQGSQRRPTAGRTCSGERRASCGSDVRPVAVGTSSGGRPEAGPEGAAAAVQQGAAARPGKQPARSGTDAARPCDSSVVDVTK